MYDLGRLVSSEKMVFVLQFWGRDVIEDLDAWEAFFSGGSSGFSFLPSHSRYCFYNTELLQKTDKLKSWVCKKLPICKNCNGSSFDHKWKAKQIFSTCAHSNKTHLLDPLLLIFFCCILVFAQNSSNVCALPWILISAHFSCTPMDLHVCSKPVIAPAL